MKGIVKAKTFAKIAHSGQKDDCGEDYYESHLIPVLNAVMALTDDKEIWMAAILHDIIEDSPATYDYLVEEFGKRVADLVNEVTHEGEADSYGRYFPRLKTADGILIKLCDRASNISRMDNWKEDRKEHYKNKTKFWKSEGPKNG